MAGIGISAPPGVSCVGSSPFVFGMTIQGTPKSKHCSLCFRTDQHLTPEHVIPFWVSDFLRPTMGPTGIMPVVNGHMIHPLADRIQIKVPVCEPCNRWMNEWIEEPARDLLKELLMAARTRVDLTRAQQMHLAIWLVKTKMMKDAFQDFPGAEGPRIPRQHVRYLFEHGIPADSVTVWIGCLSEDALRHPAPENVPPEPDLDHKMVTGDGWGSTACFGQLFHLIVGQASVVAHKTIDLPVEAEPYLLRIWPPSDDVMPWPPSKVICGPTVRAFWTMLVHGEPWPS